MRAPWKIKALRAFADKFSKGQPDNEKEIQSSLDYVFVYKLVPALITGKKAIDYVEAEAKKQQNAKA